MGFQFFILCLYIHKVNFQTSLKGWTTTNIYHLFKQILPPSESIGTAEEKQSTTLGLVSPIELKGAAACILVHRSIRMGDSGPYSHDRGGPSSETPSDHTFITNPTTLKKKCLQSISITKKLTFSCGNILAHSVRLHISIFQ